MVHFDQIQASEKQGFQNTRFLSFDVFHLWTNWHKVNLKIESAICFLLSYVTSSGSIELHCAFFLCIISCIISVHLARARFPSLFSYMYMLSLVND